MNKVAIIGAGPGGLFSAYLLLKKGYEVDLYDQSSGLAKKFLIAGNGGLNLTHSEPIDIFCTRYGKDADFFNELLNEFSPTDLRKWCEEIGVETFIGSSGRVFPKNLQAGEMLVKWSNLLKSNKSFNLFLKHSLIKIAKDKTLTLKHAEDVFALKYDKIILSLGGASWSKTGSDGKWKNMFEDLEIIINPFLPMNCGFETTWSDHFIKKMAHTPLKNVVLNIGEHQVRGEVMLTEYGIEGGAVYAVSNFIRDEIEVDGSAEIMLDLKPDLSENEIKKRLYARDTKDSISKFLTHQLKLPKDIYTLLVELSDRERFGDLEYLAKQIKQLKIILNGTRPLDEAISTSGGIKFEDLSSNLELKMIPGVYIVGEMLDFEAPTGGYLLQGCFSTAFRAVKSFR